MFFIDNAKHLCSLHCIAADLTLISFYSSFQPGSWITHFYSTRFSLFSAPKTLDPTNLQIISHSQVKVCVPVKIKGAGWGL